MFASSRRIAPPCRHREPCPNSRLRLIRLPDFTNAAPPPHGTWPPEFHPGQSPGFGMVATPRGDLSSLDPARKRLAMRKVETRPACPRVGNFTSNRTGRFGTSASKQCRSRHLAACPRRFLPLLLVPFEFHALFECVSTRIRGRCGSTLSNSAPPARRGMWTVTFVDGFHGERDSGGKPLCLLAADNVGHSCGTLKFQSWLACCVVEYMIPDTST